MAISHTELTTALESADIPSLMVTLAHLTGDLEILRGSIRPSSDFFGEPHGGINEQDQAHIRQLALATIPELLQKTAGDEANFVPNDAQIEEMINFITGAEISQDYVDFLKVELGLDGRSPYAVTGLDALSEQQKKQFKVIIIGAGMSGLLAAIRLGEAGISYTVIEKNPEVGGTWFENTYPGCRVDSPNHNYCYSFAPNDWPQHYSTQPVLLDYFKDCAQRYQLRQHIQFNSEVSGAVFDEDQGLWTVSVKNSEGKIERIEANAVISAVGQLNRPRLPNIDGMDSFAGASFHSAQWQHQHDLKGKRVVVIGTGATAFQFIPEIAKTAAKVTVFQRSPPWISPREDYHADIPAGKHWLLKQLPRYADWFRFGMFWRTSEGLFSKVQKQAGWEHPVSISPENDELRVALTQYITDFCADDEVLLSQITPQYPPAGKRMLVDNGTWLKALTSDKVDLITEGISSINENGVSAADGSHYPADVIIYATGFQANQFLFPMDIIGREKQNLRQQWGDDPRAYMGITMPGFPNFFCLYGPNTNIVVNGSIIFFSECSMRYTLGCIKTLLTTHAKTMEVKQQVCDDYNQRIDAGNLNMAWGAENVSSWYKNSKGRVTQNWPFALLKYWQQTQAPEPEDFIFN